MSLFERYLTVWVGLCIIVGVLVGWPGCWVSITVPWDPLFVSVVFLHRDSGHARTITANYWRGRWHSNRQIPTIKNGTRKSPVSFYGMQQTLLASVCNQRLVQSFFVSSPEGYSLISCCSTTVCQNEWIMPKPNADCLEPAALVG